MPPGGSGDFARIGFCVEKVFLAAEALCAVDAAATAARREMYATAASARAALTTPAELPDTSMSAGTAAAPAATPAAPRPPFSDGERDGAGDTDGNGDSINGVGVTLAVGLPVALETGISGCALSDPLAGGVTTPVGEPLEVALGDAPEERLAEGVAAALRLEGGEGGCIAAGVELGVRLPEGETEGEDPTDSEAVGEPVRVADCVGVREKLALGVPRAVGVGVGEPVVLGVRVADPDGLGVNAADAEELGEREGVPLGLAPRDSVAVGVKLGDDARLVVELGVATAVIEAVPEHVPLPVALGVAAALGD